MIPAIIPVYKEFAKLERCKKHLRSQTVPVEIWEWDNSINNIQFTAAVNKGFRHYLNQDCEYMMTINQDMYLEPHAVENMVKCMDAHPECGIAAPLQIAPDNPDHVSDGGGGNTTPVGQCFVGALSLFSSNNPMYWVSGACMMIRKAMMIEVGLFDENLIFIGSDSDYCFTARSRGWEVWSVVTARGVHDMGEAYKTDPAFAELKHNDIHYWKGKWQDGLLFNMLEYAGTMAPGTVNRARNFAEKENVV